MWQFLSLKGAPKEYINHIQALYLNTTCRVRGYGGLSTESITSSSVPEGCPLSPFLFNFITDTLLELTFSPSDFFGVDLFPRDKLVDLEYTDDIVVLGEEAGKMQNLLTTLIINISVFGMRFSSSRRSVPSGSACFGIKVSDREQSS
ncbi:polyprotein [Schistosoma japonicum]|uniref:Polyprotein n=1 Tax=Schistosoma japonicum TaxID=6182 RepID=A0A4Z2DWS6_SCHJA|nr:polyprotein [Schistosoma japonicum]